MKYATLLFALAAALSVSSPVPIRIAVVRITSSLPARPVHIPPPTRLSLSDDEALNQVSPGEDDSDGPIDNRPISPSLTIPASKVLDLPRPLTTEYLMSLLGMGSESSPDRLGAVSQDGDETPQEKQHRQCMKHFHDATSAVESWWDGTHVGCRLFITFSGLWLFIGLVRLATLPCTRQPSKGTIRLEPDQLSKEPLSLKADDAETPLEKA